MTAIATSIVIEAPAAAVWAELADVASHAEWMVDAAAITFVGSQRSGTGTTFDCATRVGPLRLTDRMEVTEWTEPVVLGVRHTGLVTGRGRFMLGPVPGGATELHWTEDLTFPWWMAGRLGAFAGARCSAGCGSATWPI